MKRFTSYLLIAVMLLALLPLNVFAETEQFIPVRTIEDLYNIRLDLTANYILMNDIDLTEATAEGGDWDYLGNGWNPIGSENKYESTAFSGKFDGNGKKIIGMRIDLVTYPSGVTSSSVTHLGLFANITGSVYDLTMKNVSITGGKCAGSLAAKSDGATITNCIVTGSISQVKTSVGGFIGEATSTEFKYCVNRAEVVGGAYVGGLAGSLLGESIADQCYNEISVTSNESYGYVYEYKSTNGFKANSRYYNYAGGICARSETSSTITNCYNVAPITVITEEDYSNSTTNYWYYAYAGGICGSGSPTISSCYNIATVSSSPSDTTTYAISSSSKISNCYYLADSGAASTNAMSLTAGQMKLKSMYQGFDFETIWVINSEAEYFYPTLRNRAIGDPDTCKHSYEDTVVAPTCSEAGYTRHYCYLCGHSYTDTKVSANGHSYTSVVTEPTCTTEGYTTYTCSICADSYTDSEIPANGHNPDGEADCTTASTCTVCGTTISDALGHDYVTAVTEPTCTEQGYTTHTCSACGDSYKDSFVRANGHTRGTEADCVNEQICTECGETLVGALGHNYIPVITAPTCTERGYTTYTCSDCGDSYKGDYKPSSHTAGTEATCTEDQICTECGDVLVEALGHTAGTEATCTEDQICTECGDVLVKALGHTAGTEVTCTEDQVCTECGDVLVGALGHTAGTEATCTEDQVCTECGDVLVGALGHTAGTEATCTEDQVCTECGDVLVGALGHTEGEWETLEDGSKELRCSVCGELLDTEAAPSFATGDVNKDGEIDMFDYAIVKKVYFELAGFNLALYPRADVDGDGEVTAFDYLIVKKAYFNS